MGICITRIIDSCVLVDIDGLVTLIDPGVFAWDWDDVDVHDIDKVDRILVTHAHADHFHLPFVQWLTERFGAPLQSTSEVVTKLAEAGIDATTDPFDGVVVTEAAHEAIPVGPQVPANIAFDIGGAFPPPGDSYKLERSERILALPMSPPWGSLTASVAYAKRLQPDIVIPIHDWTHTPDARRWMSGVATAALEPAGIRFVHLEYGESAEL
ncbi:MAG: MBL fold metallo-hydrolase [Acidimicrobiia bacterium]|nr:MBL fold metallo-hydrolase [Acidimicrobiia bacterium]